MAKIRILEVINTDINSIKCFFCFFQEHYVISSFDLNFTPIIKLI